MRIIIFIALLYVIITGCSNYKAISHKRISYEKIDNENFWCYNNQPLQGTYKVKGNVFNSYSILSYCKGKLDGEFISYEKGKIIEKGKYLNNLLNGVLTTYDRKENITVKQIYKDGFPNGHMIELNNNGDTILSKTYVSTPYEMTVYVDSVEDVAYTERTSIYILLEPCLIKSDVYSQRYYLKKDSTLIYENVWNRINDCFHELIK